MLTELMSVTGPVPVSDLGMVLPHEHTFLDVMREYRGDGLVADSALVERELVELREAGGRTLAYSGDTEWTEALVASGERADLFITECYAYDRPVRYHLDWKTLQPNLARIGAKRIMVTHMNEDMLAHRELLAAAGVLAAEDGLTLDV